MDDSQDKIFHSSKIASQTLAGATSDPFTLTDKEKKRQQKQTIRLKQQTEKAAKKIKKAEQKQARRLRFQQWRKAHRLAFYTSLFCIVCVCGLAVFGLGKVIISHFSQHTPQTPQNSKENIDPNDPISVNCQCSKDSDTYKGLKEAYVESEKLQQETIRNFDAKTANPFQTMSFIDSVIGINIKQGAVDSEGNINLDKILENINSSIESAHITDEDQKKLLELYTIKAYIEAKKYNEAIAMLEKYDPEQLYDSSKSIFYTLSYDVYSAVGDQESAKSATAAYNAIPNELDSR